MNNHVLIPTNINDITDSLSLNTKVVYIYGCLTQCDSWGIMVNNQNLIANKIGLDETKVIKSFEDLERVGLIKYFSNRNLISITDFVMWNHYKFLKANDKHCQNEKEVQIAINEKILPQGYLELPFVAVRSKKKFLMSLGVQDEIDKEVDSKDIIIPKGNTYTSTSTSDSESISDSSSANKGINKDELPF